MLAEQSFWFGALVGIALALLIATVFVAANFLKILVTLLIYLGITFPLSAVYAYILTGEETLTPTALTISIHLSFAAIVSAWVSAQYSRGKAWVTLALAGISSMTLGFALLFVAPVLGMYAAYLSMAFILALRCGFFSRAADMFRIIFKIQKKAKVEASTLPLVFVSEDYLVRPTQDLDNEKSDNSQVIVGPSGVYLVRILSPINNIRETNSKGIEIDGLDVSELTRSLLLQTRNLSRKLGLPSKDVEVIVLADNSTGLTQLIRKVGVYSPKDGNLPSRELTFLSADRLEEYVASRGKVLSSLKRDMLSSRFYSSK